MDPGPAAERPAAARSSPAPRLLAWCWQAAWRQQPGALLSAVTALALGVALALGIDLVNRSALQEFDSAMAGINGEADLRVAPREGALADRLLDPVEALASVEVASPIIETEVRALAGDGQWVRLRIIGLDVFRAARVTPQLLPTPDRDADAGAASPLFADDAVFLSAAARRAGVIDGQRMVTVLVNGQAQRLRVAGRLDGLTTDVALGVMDIAAAQQRLAFAGALTRIDLRLTPGTDRQALRNHLAAVAPTVVLVEPDSEGRRMSNLSRAYRVNLNVLALVALLTGGFIVHATMSLAITRLSSMFSLLALLGAPRSFGRRAIIGLALVMGTVGAILGVGLGIALAKGLLTLVGSDLGGGYFSGARVPLHLAPWPVAGYAALGILAAVAGALGPARRLAALQPMRNLRDGLAGPPGGPAVRLLVPVALALAGLALLGLPAIDGLPLAAYAAIACWLMAGVMLVGPALSVAAGWLRRRPTLAWRRPALWLAIGRLANLPGPAANALAGVVASFALVCAMVVMVDSFRHSVDQWLGIVLPADLYARVATTGAAASLGPAQLAAVRADPAFAQVKPLRSQALTVDDQGTQVTLLAQPVMPDRPGDTLPLTRAFLGAGQWPAGCQPAYASEPAAIRLGWTLGHSLRLPLAGARDRCFVIAGIWRDYARQQGALVLPIDQYQALTGDDTVSDLALWLADGVDAPAGIARLRALLPGLTGLEVRSATDIRRLSLRIFDRSFAVTYALEAVALLVGLFGVASTYAGEALARQREFGLLRHLGMTRHALTRLFAGEALIAIGLGTLWGGLLGAAIAQVLIHRVNPQSFHWTMQTHWPIPVLLGSGLALVACGVLAAVLAARQSGGRAPILAVRSDW
ncbi:MAG: FtsX-like permease family protein [Burkholderiaceae bacterium]